MKDANSKETAVAVGKRLIGLATKVGVRAATMGAIDSTHIKELKEIGSEIATGVSEIGSDVIEKKIEGYAAEKDALAAFRKSLTKLATKVREEKGFPLTIIVDELDRCRPDFALGLLERIKHLFEVEGIAFVLLVNQEQIENYIRAVYGSKVDARAYLLKFGSLFVDLPHQHSSVRHHYQPGLKEYCDILFAHHRLANLSADGRALNNCTIVFSHHFGLTFRELEKVFAIMTLYHSSSPSNHISDPLLVSMLAALKTCRPNLYQLLAKGHISADAFFQQTGLREVDANNLGQLNREWLVDMIDYCLMSDQELETATTNVTKPRSLLSQMGDHLGGNRKRIIPSLCWHLDRFSLRPT